MPTYNPRIHIQRRRRCRWLGTSLRLACWLASLPWPTQDDAPADYLDDDLRARVEALKADLTQAPTNAANARERAQTLWAWINAYSLTGDYVPVNATQTVSQVLAYGASEARMTNLDRFIAELTLIDDAAQTPAAPWSPTQARLRRAPTPPFARPGRWGPKRWSPAAASWWRDSSWPTSAISKPTIPGADNHVTITSSNPRVAFARHGARMSGMHGGFRGGIDNLMFRVVSGRLATGDTVTITYGDTSGGGAGILLPDFSSDRMPLPLYVDFDGSGLLVSLPIQPIVVIGGDGSRCAARFRPLGGGSSANRSTCTFAPKTASTTVPASPFPNGGRFDSVAISLAPFTRPSGPSPTKSRRKS